MSVGFKMPLPPGSTVWRNPASTYRFRVPHIHPPPSSNSHEVCPTGFTAFKLPTSKWSVPSPFLTTFRTSMPHFWCTSFLYSLFCSLPASHAGYYLSHQVLFKLFKLWPEQGTKIFTSAFLFSVLSLAGTDTLTLLLAFLSLF